MRPNPSVSIGEEKTMRDFVGAGSAKGSIHYFIIYSNGSGVCNPWFFQYLCVKIYLKSNILLNLIKLIL